MPVEGFWRIDGPEPEGCEGVCCGVLLVFIAVLELQFTARQQPRGLDQFPRRSLSSSRTPCCTARMTACRRKVPAPAS